MSARPVLLGQYRPGTTLLHRMPIGAKMLALVALAVVSTIWRGPVTGAALLAIALAAAVVARMPPGLTLRLLRPVLIAALVVGALQVWSKGWTTAATVVLDLVALVLAATVVTTTTPVDAMVETIVRACGPLRRFGVPTERVGLAIGLMIRAVPDLVALAGETRDAARARGLERDPRALLVPLAVRTVARARATGDALAARGLGDD